MSGLGSDHDTSPATRDDIAKCLEDERRAVQIHLEDRRRRLVELYGLL
jgi:hypothetical protein